MRKTILMLSLLGHVLLAHAATDGTTIALMDDDSINAILKKSRMPKLGSAVALIYDEQGQRPLYSKNADDVVSIASITKLATAMVILDAHLPLDEPISIEPEDRDRLKGSHSRMHSGMTVTRGELIKLSLMASENKAAAALARTYPGGTQVALAMMNAKARELGMDSTHFSDPTGLRSENVSTAQDLVKLVMAAQNYELIQQYSTSSSHVVKLDERRSMRFSNTNPLVRNASWDIGLSKTGYISEAGRCLVMQVKILQRPVIIVLLDSWGTRTRVGDANRIKQWMEKAAAKVVLQGSRSY
ncbi:MAG: D-alanyl-D-alanine endopeptidase [Gallionellaceae bacterium]|nr:D-alanyl-D-alanine endopeptidase [Gallionellaceae bacterium]